MVKLLSEAFAMMSASATFVSANLDRVPFKDPQRKDTLRRVVDEIQWRIEAAAQTLRDGAVE